MSDLISRADAIETVCAVVIDEFDVSPTKGYEVSEHALSALPSAETPTESTNTQTNIPTVLISKEDAIDTICKEWCYVTFDNCPHADDGFRCDGCDDVEAINALPSVEAVEVVRCKECKHSHMTYDGRCKYCDEWEGDGEALYLEGDFYCAFGKRREDGEA